MYTQNINEALNKSIGNCAPVKFGNQDIAHFLTTATQWKPLANELKLINNHNFLFFSNLVQQQNKLILMNDSDHQWDYLTNILKNVIKCHNWHINKDGAHATAAEYFMSTLFHITGTGRSQNGHLTTAVDYFQKMYKIFSCNWKGVINSDRVTNMCQSIQLPYPLPKDLPTYVRLFGLSTSMALGKSLREM